MTRLYLDTEFNGFGGALMSVALVPQDPALATFYAVVAISEPVDPWVAQHVVPNLWDEPLSRDLVSADIAGYIRSFDTPVIIADWPTDFEHLLSLLITGPGSMQALPDLQMDFMNLHGFNTADHSRVPHNALEDARALRDHCESMVDNS